MECEQQESPFKRNSQATSSGVANVLTTLFYDSEKSQYLKLWIASSHRIWVSGTAFEEELIIHFSSDCGDIITIWLQEFETCSYFQLLVDYGRQICIACTPLDEELIQFSSTFSYDVLQFAHASSTNLLEGYDN